MPQFAIKSSGIKQVATSTIIGRSTAGTGSAEQLSASTAKTLLGLASADKPTFAAITQLSSSSADPTTGDVSAGTWQLHKNTTSSKIYLAVNDSGSIVKQELGITGGGSYDQDLNTTDDVEFAEITTTGDVSISDSNTGKVTINGTTYGLKRSGTGIGLLLNNEHRFVMKTDRSAISGVYSGSTPHYWGFTNTTDADTASSAVDVRLQREAANHLAMVNGTNASTFSIANTWTDASNYERGAIKWDSNELKIGPEAAGTGSNRAMQIHTTSAALTINTTVAGTLSLYAGYTNRGRIDLYAGTGLQMELKGSSCSTMSLNAGVFDVSGNDLKNSGEVHFTGLPTSDPSVAGQVWVDSGGFGGAILKLSAG